MSDPGTTDRDDVEGVARVLRALGPTERVTVSLRHTSPRPIQTGNGVAFISAPTEIEGYVRGVAGRTFSMDIIVETKGGRRTDRVSLLLSDVWAVSSPGTILEVRGQLQLAKGG